MLLSSLPYIKGKKRNTYLHLGLQGSGKEWGIFSKESRDAIGRGSEARIVLGVKIKWLLRNTEIGHIFIW